MSHKQIKIPAKLVTNNYSIQGTLSLYDGFFKIDDINENLFVYGAKIEFSHEGENYSFLSKNIGGRYFVDNHRSNPQYQRLIETIILNKELATKDNKPNAAKRKI